MIVLQIFALLAFVVLTSGLDGSVNQVDDNLTSLKEENITTTSGFDFDSLVRILYALLSVI